MEAQYNSTKVPLDCKRMHAASSPEGSSAAHQVVIAILTDMYHYFVGPSAYFDTLRVGAFTVDWTTFVQTLERRVVDASGV